jgi:hypothetical protein
MMYLCGNYTQHKNSWIMVILTDNFYDKVVKRK